MLKILSIRYIGITNISKNGFFPYPYRCSLFNKEKNSFFYPNTCQYLVNKKIQFNLRIYSSENVLITRQIFFSGFDKSLNEQG